MEYEKEQKIYYTGLLREILAGLPECAKPYFDYELSVRNRSPRTVLNYAYDLRLFFWYLTVKNPMAKRISDIDFELLNHLTALDIQEYISFLTAYTKDGRQYTNDASGKARKLSSLRSFFKYCMDRNMTDGNPAAAIDPPKLLAKNIVKLEQEEVHELINGMETGLALTEEQLKYAKNSHYRDLAIISLLLGTGIRVSECAGINLEDINWKSLSLRIIRKGGSESIVYFNEDVADKLKDYINLERARYAGDLPALFVSRKGMRLSVRSIERLVKKYTKNVIPNKNITPHKLRSTYGTNLYRKSGDIYLTADALGHKNIEVTAKHYADIGNDKRKSAADYVDWTR